MVSLRCQKTASHGNIIQRLQAAGLKDSGGLLHTETMQKPFTMPHARGTTCKTSCRSDYIQLATLPFCGYFKDSKCQHPRYYTKLFSFPVIAKHFSACSSSHSQAQSFSYGQKGRDGQQLPQKPDLSLTMKGMTFNAQLRCAFKWLRDILVAKKDVEFKPLPAV